MIQLSSTATAEIRRHSAQMAHPNAQSSDQPLTAGTVLRLGVEPGGCAGWVYTLTFGATQRSDDVVMVVGAALDPTRREPGDELGGDRIQILLAPTIAPHLEHLHLDYSEDLMGGSFRFNNPTASKTCSCGHSFALGEPTAAE